MMIIEKFEWQIARVKSIVQETPTVKTFTLQLAQWQTHLPGQHYDIRLTAEDGYQAVRSYSVASPPEQTGEIALTVEFIEGGEISAYLHEGVAPGDPLEVRGPIGGYFVWGQNLVNLPLLLVAGGSGIVPLMAMLRHRAAIRGANPTTLLFSIRTPSDVIYKKELELLTQQDQRIDLRLTFTRQIPQGWTGYQRRIDLAMLTEVLDSFTMAPQSFICGPSGLVEQVANSLVNLGVAADIIRTERFGPT